MNVFRLSADLLHLTAIIILLVKLLWSQSAAGISGKTQILLTMVYVSRYLDLVTNFISFYNSVMKIIFIGSSTTILYLIYVHLRHTYDHKRDSFRSEILWTCAMVLAIWLNHELTPMEILWTFSIYLESVAIIPQFFLMMKSSETETVIAYYLIALGSYRALYILNWIYRYYIEQFYDNIADVAAIVQTFIFGLVFIRLAKMRKVPMGQLNAHSPTQVFTLPTPPTLGFQVPSDTEKLPQDPPPYEP